MRLEPNATATYTTDIVVGVYLPSAATPAGTLRVRASTKLVRDEAGRYLWRRDTGRNLGNDARGKILLRVVSDDGRVLFERGEAKG